MEAVKRISMSVLLLFVFGLLTAAAGFGFKFFWRAFMLGWELI
jgi:hypothetical protein